MGDVGGDGIEVTTAADGAVVLRGELDLVTAGTVENALLGLVDGAGDIVVDLSEVPFLDSAGMNLFVRCYKSLEGTDRRLILRRPQPSVRRAMEVGGMAEFAVVED